MVLSFMRNKVTDVEPLSDGGLSVSWHLTDNLLEAEVRLRVRVPDLEIVDAEGIMRRSPHGECMRALELVRKVVGVRVGPGLRKIVRGLVGGPSGCEELAEGVLECCNGVILHFTVPQIQANEKGTEQERRERFGAMVRFNPRLAGSCVAFAEDSPMMADLGIGTAR